MVAQVVDLFVEPVLERVPIHQLKAALLEIALDTPDLALRGADAHLVVPAEESAVDCKQHGCLALLAVNVARAALACQELFAEKDAPVLGGRCRQLLRLAKSGGERRQAREEIPPRFEFTWNTCYSASMRTTLHYCIEEWLPRTSVPNRITDGIVSISGNDLVAWRSMILREVVSLPAMKNAKAEHLILRSLTVLHQAP